MPRTFRHEPPEPSAAVVPRPRLLQSLLGRWEHPVTTVAGGAGMGKTTLLAQAVAENRLAPRGDDVWLGVQPQDADAGRLARSVGAALGADEGPESVAEVLWQRSPTQVCLVLDDVHRLPAGSSGAAWLAELVDGLPANGHVVLAGRAEPPVPLSRLGAHGLVLRLGEDELRFSDDELATFAERRGVGADRLAGTAGWPALAELSANVDQRLTGTYVWEEVLEPLGPARRRVLAVLADLGGGDDALVAAALDQPVDLAGSLADVPLVAHTADGWHEAHALWRDAPGLALDDGARAEGRRRAVEHLTGLGRFDDAFDLAEEAGAWDLVPAVLRAAALESDRLASGQLDRWLAAAPAEVRATPAGWLARGLLAAYDTPTAAVGPLRTAIERCREAGDVDAEIAAIAQLARLAWFHQYDDVLTELVGRVGELEATGQPTARALASVAEAAVADLVGDDEGMLAALDSIEPSALDRAWDLLVSFWAAQARMGLGDTAPIHRIVERLQKRDDLALQGAGSAMQLSAWWAEGRVDDVVAGLPAVVETMRAAGVKINLYLALNGACLAFARTGDLAGARRWYDESIAVAPVTPSGDLPLRSAVALAYVRLAEGAEKDAVLTLQSALESHGLEEGVDRDTWRQHIALGYVLLPETRPHWEARLLQGHLHTARDLARAVVAAREGRAGAVLRDLALPDLGLVRSALDVRMAVDLAVGLVEAGRNGDARALLGALGPPGRTALRDLASGGHRQSTRAKALLAAVPAAPPRRTALEVLGPVTLRRDGPGGEPVEDPDLRRSRVRTLLGFLVLHRQTTRAAAMAALWPDLDERAAANNLAVTLNRLLALLEPWRHRGEPASLVRLDGQALRLAVGPDLLVDVDDFERHLAAAARAEADGIPSLALEHDLAAVDLYRDDLLADLPDAAWLSLDREHFRNRFVTTAVRAGQLLLGRGDVDAAETVGRRALAVDHWAEDAYGVLVGAALARGDQVAARRTMALCLDALHELGADPSPATEQLARRLS
jgi:DNA-binding SARP family transcriptional activator/ATP/maltotriose-dependent transcriptional regulator MalT